MSLVEEHKPDVPTLTKNITPIKWLESFKDCLSSTFGVLKAPLSYIIRENREVTSEDYNPLHANFLYSANSVSVLNELGRRLTFEHPLFQPNNTTVFSMLEEATWSTIYSPKIKPFFRIKNG